jgi:predicted transcriptional regulator of viral defense system
MYIDHMKLMHDFRDYASPKARLTRLLKAGNIIQVRRGIFLDAKDNDYSLKSLASTIYGPSYISFEYALSHYGLIPERVHPVTSAVYRKNKNRRFRTPLGDFYYYYLPAEVYPYGITREEEQHQSYLIATPEKALLDMLYKARGISNKKSLTNLLFEDWRMEYDSVTSLDGSCIASLAPMYRKKAVMLFRDWFTKEVPDAQRNPKHD